MITAVMVLWLSTSCYWSGRVVGVVANVFRGALVGTYVVLMMLVGVLNVSQRTPASVVDWAAMLTAVLVSPAVFLATGIIRIVRFISRTSAQAGFLSARLIALRVPLLAVTWVALGTFFLRNVVPSNGVVLNWLRPIQVGLCTLAGIVGDDPVRNDSQVLRHLHGDVRHTVWEECAIQESCHSHAPGVLLHQAHLLLASQGHVVRESLDEVD